MNSRKITNSFKVFIEGYIRPLSDKKFQEDVWINGQWEKWATFDEIFMNFCDYCEPIIDNPQKYNLDTTQIQAIKKLYQLFEAYDDNNSEVISLEDYKRLLKDPKWREIQAQAKKIKEMFVH
ncbi:MAG: hypothetical protein KFB93_08045 [Simkaniaceae bacterium]|nr:MAG: hypothetical protein KFB93_08045 [Simkaniaceae bacterium]